MKSETTEEFLFPFSTCEKPNNIGIAQPYSFLINIVSLLVIFYFLCITVKPYNFLLILSLFAFEIVHTFSHYIHLPDRIQVNIIHPISYIVNIFFFINLSNTTKIIPPSPFLLYLLIVFCVDLYFFLTLPFVYSFTSSFLMFFSIILFFYRFLPNEKKTTVQWILFLAICILLSFFNEKYNCKYLLSNFPTFPFHIILETIGLFTFYIVCRFFYNL
jgi:hypothetical protein